MTSYSNCSLLAVAAAAEAGALATSFLVRSKWLPEPQTSSLVYSLAHHTCCIARQASPQPAGA